MSIKITWKPVLQALALKDYHADYGDEKIMVCVNPQPAFLRVRSQLMNDYAGRYSEVELLDKKAQIASDERKHEAETAAGRASTELMDWAEKVFIPGINGWFASLWSFGDDTFTVEDLNEYHSVDPHFLNWLKARSIEMIENHASARKKV